MRAPFRATFVLGAHRWLVKRAIELEEEDRPRVVEPFAAISLADAWCNDVVAWPVMDRLYEDLSGDRLRPPVAVDVEERIRPRLHEAFRRGELVLIALPLLGELRSEAEEGIHGGGGKLDLAPELARPRQVTRIAQEKTFLDVEVVDAEGKPVVGRRFKLQLPDGHTETGKLGPDARIRRMNIDPGTAFLSFLDDDAPAVHAEGIEPQEVDVTVATATFSIQVTMVDGAPISGLDIAFVSAGSRVVVPTDKEGIARFKGPESPLPTAQVVDAKQLRTLVDDQGAG